MNSQLTKSIRQILLAGSTALYTAGMFAAVGQQNPPPGPGQVPDYFGVVPNFANSPQPVLIKAIANTGSAVRPGEGASATVTWVPNGGITKITPDPAAGTGLGYVTPKVTITDQGLGSGAAVSVTTTAASGGGLIGVPAIVVPGSDCALNDPVTIAGASGSGASASVTGVNNGAVTEITLNNGGTGYTGATASFEVACSGTVGVQNASGTIAVDPGTPGVISSITIDQGGQNYITGAKVIFSDLNRTATGNTEASAHVSSVDANGAITGITLDEPGSGYTATTTAIVKDIGTGTGAEATATAKKVGGVSGVITAIKVTAAGTGFRNPLVEFSDTNAGAAGQGAVLAATTYDYTNDVMTDKVMDVQVLNPGSGYDAGTTVNITGGPGATPVTVTPIIVNGGIVGIEGIDIPDAASATGYTRDPNFIGLNLGNGYGSGYKTPIAGTGIRKFVDSLPQLNLPGRSPNNLGQILPIAVPDTTTFPGSDYYEIAETEYSQKLHSDLPPTHLRGYKQLNVSSNNAAAQNQYLGPIIVAQKDRPVRIKLVNQLSKSSDATGLKGHLPLPVDTTYMGADGASDTDNRTALHLHGGNTPWISDGTPRQWVKPIGETSGPNKGESARDVPDMYFVDGVVVPACTTAVTDNCSKPAGEIQNKLPAGASNNPGDGALTFFYTNEQSARLMFYHDHAEGTTRLNVYAGMAAGYVLQDQSEQALIDNGTLPPLADTIPLVIQEKTFVPDDTNNPVLNFYGPFRSQLNSQDPTWRWGTGTQPTGMMGNGDLWVPHVFMPNQNPGDVSGANSMGRWDYGAWFWPPFANLQNQPIANPYYDPTCNTTTSYCEGSTIPGVPNGSLQNVLSNGVPGGVPDATNGGLKTESPSGTPESFNDTPLVNGTAYPYINVDPKKYRLRILSVGNDRMLNLSFVVAASKNTDTTADANAGTGGPAILCNGSTTVDPSDCTEVKMVPFTSTQNTATPFPAHWYSKQKGGVTFDGRPAGVFDPRTRGPQMVQIGTEGGFLSSPVAIPNQPVNYEYNPKNILIGNIKEHALLLAPAERADVVVDFSHFAGSTLILYNDAGAPVPAWDLRLDYYTGNFDNTDTGGAFSVIPGYGPNSRTLMQFRVSNNGGDSSHPVDDLNQANLNTMTAAVRNAFKTSQEPIIVPQSAYNATYGINATDALGQDLSRISDNQLTYWPLNTALPPPYALVPINTANKVTLELEPKTIIEDWTMNWGRMNALLGTEVPHTTAINQTSIPQAYVDPPTDLVKITPNDNMVPISGTRPDGTQIWKITHNGVDSHGIHFHLFHVQIVNRVGWDGAIYSPDANELGWKDTVRMNPLSDTIVALRPMRMNSLPFKVPNSHRKLNPKLASGVTSDEFFNFGPLSGNASNVTNLEVNYGWEYVWHCHILGHEENDMMRPIAVAQAPEKPIILANATQVAEGIKVEWTDNSIISNWVTVQRALDSNFETGLTTFNVPVTECNQQNGCARSYTDSAAPADKTLYYRVMANNTVGAGDGKLDAPRNPDGSYSEFLPAELSSLTPGFNEYANVTANSEWSGTATYEVKPTATVTPESLALSFGNQLVNTSSAGQTVTLKNTGNANLSISNVALSSGTDFVLTSNSCAGSPKIVAPNATCTVDVAFKPSTKADGLTANLVFTDNSSTGTSQTVVLTGNGIAPNAVLSGNALAFEPILIGSTSAAQTVTLSNNGNAPLTINSISPPAQFVQTNDCGLSLGAGLSCTINVAFKPTLAGAASGDLSFTDNSNGLASVQKVALSGTGVLPLTPAMSIPTIATNPGSPVMLSWSASSSVLTQPDSYQVYRTAGTTNTALNCATATYSALGSSTALLTRADTTRAAGQTYCYYVVATNAAGTFASNRVKIILPAAPAIPASVTISGLTANSLTFSWAASTSTGTSAPVGYLVQQCQGSAATGNCGAAGAGWANLGTVAAGTTSYNVTGLIAGTPYLFRVGAYNPFIAGWRTSGVVAYPVAVNDLFTATSNTSASQGVTGNVLGNDLPQGLAGRTVTNVSAVVHTTGGGANPATATVAFNTTTGAFTLTLTSPVANNTTTLRQASKRGTYTFTYTETYGGITTSPVTVTLTMN